MPEQQPERPDSADQSVPQTDAYRRQAEELLARGKTALLDGDQAEADRLLAEATALYANHDDSYGIAAQTGNYGWALRRAGQPDRARPYLQRAAELFAALEMHDFAERHRQAAEAADSTPVTADLSSLPPAVRDAVERGDVQGLQIALSAFPLAEQQLLLKRLEEAGVIRVESEDTADEALQQFAPLLEGIASVALGDTADRAEIEAIMPNLRSKGWNFIAAAPAIWAGERDLAKLTRGLDKVDRRLVARVLKLIAQR